MNENNSSGCLPVVTNGTKDVCVNHDWDDEFLSIFMNVVVGRDIYDRMKR
jgi:uncharacterized protein YdeI (YjbR/CyaY-like superfamily)